MTFMTYSRTWREATRLSNIGCKGCWGEEKRKRKEVRKRRKEKERKKGRKKERKERNK